MSGQSAGIGANAVSAFTEQCIEERDDISSRLQIFPNPYAANPNFSNDPALLSDLKRCRARLMNATQVVIAFCGGMGTEAEIELAKRRNCKIIPVALSKEELENKAIKKITEDKAIMNYLEKVDSEYYTKLIEGEVLVEDIITCIRKIWQGV